MTEVYPYDDDDWLESLGKSRRRNPKPQTPAPTPEELVELTETLKEKAKESGRREKGDEL